jgi:hypothetical protein
MSRGFYWADMTEDLSFDLVITSLKGSPASFHFDTYVA